MSSNLETLPPVTTGADDSAPVSIPGQSALDNDPLVTPGTEILPPVVRSRPRIRAVDGARALAIFMVFTYHIWQNCGSPGLSVPALGIRFGSLINGFPAGVDLFMVLSGFCLFWPLCIKPETVSAWSWKNYAKRRAHRIIPPYYAAILYMTLLPVVLVALFHVLHQPAKWQPLPSLWQYVTHLLFIHTLFPSTWDGIQGAFWSLGLEAQFYVVFPLVVLAYRRWGIKVAAGMTLASIIYRIIAGLMTAHEPFVSQFLPSIFFLGRWMQFAAGMTAAWLVARSLRTETPFSTAFGYGALVGALALYTLALSPMAQAVVWFPMRDLLLAVAFAGALVALCASGCHVRKFFESRVVVWVGTISYSIFLIHQNTIYYAEELLKKVLHLDGAARFAVLDTFGFVFIVGLAALFFKLFEAPFLNGPPQWKGKSAKAAQEPAKPSHDSVVPVRGLAATETASPQ